MTEQNNLFFRKKGLLILVGAILIILGIVIQFKAEGSQLLGYLLIFLGATRIIRAFLR
jgi:hypothetical protein